MMDCLKDENVDWYRWLEKRVCVKGTLFGTLKYFGTTKFSDGLWCGVELDEPIGKNNGIVNNIKYFTCLPNFGIFVPESKVRKIESDPKNLDDTFMHLNGTVNLQKCLENPVIVSSSDSQPYDCNEEMGEIRKDKTMDIKQDSEESLGLLDPNLLESFDFFNLDTDVDIVPDFQDALLKLDNQGSGSAASNLPTSDILFSDEIISPKYASTPRHPAKKRLTNFRHIATGDRALQNVDEDDVFENQIDFGQEVFFDTEKFKRNPNLASTSEVFQIPPDASSNTDILSPVSFSPISDSVNLNKTQIIPIQFLANQDIIRPFTMDLDLNKTQTLQNEYQAPVSKVGALNATFKMPTEIDSTETKDLNLTVCLKSNEGSENYQKSSHVETLVDTTLCKNINLNSTFDSDLKFADAALKKIPASHETENATFKMPTEIDSTETKDLNLTVCLKSSEGSENFQKSSQVETLADTTLCKNFNSTFDSDLKFADAALKKIPTSHGTDYSGCDLNPQETADICLSKTLDNNSSSPQMNGVDKDESLLQKTFVLDSSSSEDKHNNEQVQLVDVLNNVVQFEPFDYKNKFLEETSSDVNTRNSVSIPPESRNSLIKPRRFSNSLDLNSTFKTKGRVISNSSFTSKSQGISNLQLKTNNVGNKTGEFKKPLSIYSIRKPKDPLKKSVSAKENSSFFKGSVLANSDKPLVSRLIPKTEKSSGDIKLVQERKNSSESKSVIPGKSTAFRPKFSYSQNAETVMESKAACNLPLQNKNIASSKILNKVSFSASKGVPTNDLNMHGVSKVSLNSVKNTAPGKTTINQTSNNLAKNPNVINLDKSLVSGIEPKNNLKSVDLKLEQEKENERYYSIENKSVSPSKSLVSSRRFSSSQSIKTSFRSSIASNLPNKDSGSKINFSLSTKAVPTNDLNVPGTSQVPSNNMKNALLPKKTINQTSTGLAKIPSSQFKGLIPRQSLGVYSNGNGIPRCNSLAVRPKTNHPASRHSMLPSIEEGILCAAKDTGDKGQLANSNDHFVPETVLKVNCHTIADSNISSRIATSLPRKSHISTRKTGLKYSDVKEEGITSPKIPRYNLRGKK